MSGVPLLRRFATSAGIAGRLVLVGRPNVGKSTLFNRICDEFCAKDIASHPRRNKRGRWSGERRQAIVSAVPGTTRDYREGRISIDGARYTVVDTGGLDLARRPKICQTTLAVDDEVDVGDIATQTRQALTGSGVVLFVADASAGVTALDHHFAAWLRKASRNMRDDGLAPVIACALNKVDAVGGSSRADGGWQSSLCLRSTLDECRALGFGNPLLTSGIHGHGLDDIYRLLAARPRGSVLGDVGDGEQDERRKRQRWANPACAGERVQIALVGRPNTGKSSIMNRLVGRTRSIAGPTSGLTRDAVFAVWPTHGSTGNTGKGRRRRMGRRATCRDGDDVGENYPRPHLRMELVDTAGMRRNRAMQSDVEALAANDSVAAVAFAHVVAVVIDGPLMRQDLAIIGKVVSEGRAVIVLANKVDVFQSTTNEQPSVVSEFVREQLRTAGVDVYNIAVIPMSASTGLGIDSIRPEVEAVYRRWNKRVTAKELNAWLQKFSQSNPPPRGFVLVRMAQEKIRPPTFKVVFTSNANRKVRKMPLSFTRCLGRALHESFGFGGVPLRIYYSPAAACMHD